MARRKDRAVKLFTVCGTVFESTLLKLQREVTLNKPVARVVGEILEFWAKDKPEVKRKKPKDERQIELELIEEEEEINLEEDM